MALEMTTIDHRRWMAENNPEGWSTEQWAAFARLMDIGGVYAQAVRELTARRHAWVNDRVAEEIGNRNVAPKVRLKIRREYLRSARLEIPNPDPLEAMRRVEREHQAAEAAS